MANYNTIHVYPDGDVWVVKKGAAARASAIRDTQREAYIAARDIALNQGLSITVHGPDGRIQRVVTPREAASSSDCFITTACVTHMGLSDDCYELTTLRKFRDEFIKSRSGGSELINQYYLVGPKIVHAIDHDPNRKRLYENLYFQIVKACGLIDGGKGEEAFQFYVGIVRDLSSKFKLS